jgi:hypothetical protein
MGDDNGEDEMPILQPALSEIPNTDEEYDLPILDYYGNPEEEARELAALDRVMQEQKDAYNLWLGQYDWCFDVTQKKKYFKKLFDDKDKDEMTNPALAGQSGSISSQTDEIQVLAEYDDE